MIDLVVQNESTFHDIPNEENLKKWVTTVLDEEHMDAELCIRIVDEEESAELNNYYRKKNRPTNILSFPNETLPGVKSHYLGDLVICAPLVSSEANEQSKLLADHWAHLVIHGILHLLGYDHEDELDAEVMEGIEIKILKQLGIKNPYIIEE